MKATITLLILVLVFALNIECQELNRDASTDLLKITVEGGTQGFRDETYIHFDEDATTGYDVEIDAIKWYSIDPEATMIWSIASDNTELAINNLPQGDLYGILNTIPMTFVCGYGGGEYTLSFSEMDTFDESVEIWIEDQVTGDGWLDITDEENTYTFSALPEDAPDRFKIHILDPNAITDINNQSASDPKKIYSSGNKIFLNKINVDQVKDIVVYNLLGQIVSYEIITSSNDLSTLQIKGNTGYYVVRITVNNQTQSEKIYIKNS